MRAVSATPSGNPFPAWAESQYRCIRRISQATTATVWLVRRASGDSSRLYVLKELHLDRELDATALDEPQEVLLLTSQKHPFIIPVVEMLRPSPGQLGMVTEYCDQGDLHSLLIELRRRGEHVPEAQVLAWLAQLCLALSHLHKQHILHRDVKTSNIFVTADRTLKLGDFGLARLTVEQEAITSRVGSPFYMSPEICLHQPYGSASDLWSLGCVLYEIICLAPAFYAESMGLVLERICKAQYAPPPEGACSSGVRELLSRLLTLDPKVRISAHEVLEHPALRPVLEQLEPEQPPPASFFARLEADSDDAAAMRAAVRAAAELAANDSAAEPEATATVVSGAFSLLGLALLAERGLSLLGLGGKAWALAPAQRPAASSPEPKPSPSERAAELLTEVQSSLHSMHALLGKRLGEARFDHALRLATSDLPAELEDGAAWNRWEAAKAVELAAYLRSEGAPPSPPSLPSTFSPRSSPSPSSSLGDGSEASVARAILALALWSRVTEAEAAGGGDQALSSLRGQRSRSSLLSILF